MFNYIDRLVTSELFALQVWDNVCGAGVWAALGSDDDQVDYFRNLPNKDDGFAEVAVDLVLSTTWLPYVLGNSMLDAIKALESRVIALPEDEHIRESDWTDLIDCAIHDLKSEHKAFSKGVKNEVSIVLAKPFDVALEILTARFGSWPRNSMRQLRHPERSLSRA